MHAAEAVGPRLVQEKLLTIAFF